MFALSESNNEKGAWEEAPLVTDFDLNVTLGRRY